jgi:hypothetical protein
MPSWLCDTHTTLDHAVLGAYGWPPDVIDDEVLASDSSDGRALPP